MFGAGEEREYEITKERDELKKRVVDLTEEQAQHEDMIKHYFDEATNFQSVTELVRNYPNNAELGSYVRALVKKYTDSLSSKPNT